MLAVVVLSSASLSGCGGGSTGTSATASTTGDLTFVRVEGNLHSNGKAVDLGSLIAGDVVDLKLVGFDSSLAKKTIPGATFGTSASASQISIAGSTLTVHTDTAGSTFKVTGLTAKYSGDANLASVPAGGAIVTGRVRNTFGTGIYFVKVKFYSGVTLIRSTHTVSDGTFRIGVPTSVNRFTIDLDEADPVGTDGFNKYYRQFGFGDFDYTANSPSCLAPTPALVIGNNTMGDIVPALFGAGSPPPPPTGCFG